MDDTQIAIAKTAFALAGLSAGIGKIATALTKLNSAQNPEASAAIVEAVSTLQPVAQQINEMLDAIQRIMK